MRGGGADEVGCVGLYGIARYETWQPFRGRAWHFQVALWCQGTFGHYAYDGLAVDPLEVRISQPPSLKLSRGDDRVHIQAPPSCLSFILEADFGVL
jgi:hypothetical protein